MEKNVNSVIYHILLYMSEAKAQKVHYNPSNISICVCIKEYLENRRKILTQVLQIISGHYFCFIEIFDFAHTLL